MKKKSGASSQAGSFDLKMLNIFENWFKINFTQSSLLSCYSHTVLFMVMDCSGRSFNCFYPMIKKGDESLSLFFVVVVVFFTQLHKYQKHD